MGITTVDMLFVVLMITFCTLLPHMYNGTTKTEQQRNSSEIQDIGKTNLVNDPLQVKRTQEDDYVIAKMVNK